MPVSLSGFAMLLLVLWLLLLFMMSWLLLTEALSLERLSVGSDFIGILSLSSWTMVSWSDESVGLDKAARASLSWSWEWAGLVAVRPDDSSGWSGASTSTSTSSSSSWLKGLRRSSSESLLRRFGLGASRWHGDAGDGDLGESGC